MNALQFDENLIPQLAHMLHNLWTTMVAGYPSNNLSCFRQSMMFMAGGPSNVYNLSGYTVSIREAKTPGKFSSVRISRGSRYINIGGVNGVDVMVSGKVLRDCSVNGFLGALREMW
jgi:hypothetical protein